MNEYEIEEEYQLNYAKINFDKIAKDLKEEPKDVKLAFLDVSTIWSSEDDQS